MQKNTKFISVILVLIIILTGCDSFKKVKEQPVSAEKQNIQFGDKKPQNMKIIEIVENYDQDVLPYFMNIGGKIFFKFNTTPLKSSFIKSFFFYDGKKSLEYSDILFPSEIDGKLAFVQKSRLSDGKFRFRAVYDGQELGKEYYSTLFPFKLNGKIGFSVIDESGKKFFVYDGKEFGKEYDTVGRDSLSFYRLNFNNKFTYIASNGGKHFVVQDGKKVSQDYDDISWGHYLLKENNNNKLFFIASDGGKKFVIYDNRQIGGEYDDVYNVIESGDQVIFDAKKGDKFIIFKDGQETEYSYSFYIAADINNKPAFIANRDGKKLFLLYNNEQLGGSYVEISYVFPFNNKPSFLARKEGDDKKYIFVYDGQEVATDYSVERPIMELAGKMFFEANQGKTGKIIMLAPNTITDQEVLDIKNEFKQALESVK